MQYSFFRGVVVAVWHFHCIYKRRIGKCLYFFFVEILYKNETNRLSEHKRNSNEMAKHFVDSEKLVSRKRQQLRSILIIIFGALCAAGSGYLTYHVLNTAEINEFEKDYELLTEGIAAEAGVALSRTQQVCEHHASIISAMFPDAEQWPLVSLPR